MRKQVAPQALECRYRSASPAVAAVLGLSLAICGWAVDSPPRTAAAVSETKSELEEITVTAQKREQKLQDVPLSAQVIGAPELSQQNLNSLTSVSETVPSVHVGASARSSELYIRGIGSGYNQSFDQSVGLFIDDIYHGRSRTTAATFLDLDHLEVLKGPQSTFFGNNAIAGALNILTQKPGRTFDSWVRALYGQNGQYALEGAAGGPVSDTFRIRAAASYNGQRGWLENVNTGTHVPRDQNLAGRVTLAFQPNEDFQALLKMEGGRNRNKGGLALQTVNCPPPPPFTIGSFCKSAIALGVPTGLDNDRKSDSAGQKIDYDSAETVLTLDYQRWGQTFTSVSGYYNYDYELNFDVDALPANLLQAQIPEHYHQFSQELRVASPTGRALEYLAGL